MADPIPNAPLTTEDIEQDITELEIRLADLQADLAILENSDGDKTVRIESTNQMIFEVEEALALIQATLL